MLPSVEASGHAALQREAIELEGRAHRLLLDGDLDGARPLLREAAGRYRASWEAAPPRAFGRLIGLLKASVLAEAGGPESDSAPEAAGEAAIGAAEAAGYVRAEIGPEADSPPSWYALAIAGLIEGDDDLAARGAEGMRAGGEPFERAADAIAALAAGDRGRYARAVRAIVDDFAAREAHLTGVPIADTALLLELLALPRGLATGVDSPLLPTAALAPPD
jgi:hypothetical protein